MQRIDAELAALDRPVREGEALGVMLAWADWMVERRMEEEERAE